MCRLQSLLKMLLIPMFYLNFLTSSLDELLEIVWQRSHETTFLFKSCNSIDELYIRIENVSRIIREIHPARIYNERHCFKDFFNVIVFFRFHIRNAT
jgi:hypothetical protein